MIGAVGIFGMIEDISVFRFRAGSVLAIIHSVETKTCVIYPNDKGIKRQSLRTIVLIPTEIINNYNYLRFDFFVVVVRDIIEGIAVNVSD